jgi:hypothetical protein
MKLSISLSCLLLATTTSATWPVQSFQSSNLTPPVFDINSNGALAPGYLFLTPSNGDNNTGEALIMTDNGTLIWSSGPTTFTANLQTAVTNNTFHSNILTYWTASANTANTSISRYDIGYGKVHILDTSYNESYTICPKLNLVTLNDAVPECQLDFHESYMPSSPAADYIVVTAYNITQANLTSVGGPSDGWVWDSLLERSCFRGVLYGLVLALMSRRKLVKMLALEIILGIGSISILCKHLMVVIWSVVGIRGRLICYLEKATYIGDFK